MCAGAFPIVYPHPTYVDLVEASGFGRVASSSTPAALTHAIRRAVEDGEPRRDPPAAWRAGHAWPRVARSLLARLDGLLA